MRNKIGTVYPLRAFAFLGIFLSHTQFKIFAAVGWWGVSLFLILSGFLMVYSYYGLNRISSVYLKDNIQFLYQKIGYLYPLHILLMLAMSVFCLTGGDRYTLVQFSVAFILNIFMVQDWFPIQARFINSVSWYLCVMVLTYFLFPWILHCMKSKYNRKKAFISMIILFLIQLLWGITGSKLTKLSKWNEGWVENITSWFVYFFPLARLIDFLIGCNLGYLFFSAKHRYSKRIYTVLEAFATLLTIFACLSSIMIDQNKEMLDSKKWYAYTLNFTISTCVLIYVFAVGKGKISKFVTGKATFYIAQLSTYVF